MGNDTQRHYELHDEQWNKIKLYFARKSDLIVRKLLADQPPIFEPVVKLC